MYKETLEEYNDTGVNVQNQIGIRPHTSEGEKWKLSAKSSPPIMVTHEVV